MLKFFTSGGEGNPTPQVQLRSQLDFLSPEGNPDSSVKKKVGKIPTPFTL